MLFIDNKYTRIYYTIIERAKSRTLSGYIERHHIIPRSLGGVNRKSNVVELTAREHYICHRLLPKMTTGQHKKKMWHALRMMANCNNKHMERNIKVTSHTYNVIRESISKLHSGKRNPMYGKRHTSEAQKKMREAAKTKIRTSEHNRNIGLSQIGKVVSSDTKQKMKEAHKHREKFSCEHCGKDDMLKHLYIRWHGPNCKHR